MRYFIPRTRMVACSFIQSRCNRALHVATGRFTALSAQGAPATREVEVWLGDPGESYVMFDPEISQYFQTGIIQQGGCSLTKDPELYPLIFHHSTRHFSHKMFPYPRLEIPQDLPKQSNAHDSPATLHAHGVTHSITLDGTPDEAFHLSMRESFQRLQPVLDQLKET